MKGKKKETHRQGKKEEEEEQEEGMRTSLGKVLLPDRLS